MPIYKDGKRKGYFVAGWVLANFALYRGVATEGKGDVSKLRAALKKHQFEGVVNDDGTLSYAGVTADWRTLDKV